MLLHVENLSVSHRSGGKEIPLTHNVSFTLDKHQCLGIVGESGSGKSITCSAINGLLDSQHFSMTGKAIFHDENLLEMDVEKRRSLRGKKICMILQNPNTAFNPLFTIGEHVVETVMAHYDSTPKKALETMEGIFEKVNLKNAELIFNKFPHELSGGMLQRIMVALALAMQPDLIIADEPTTAIDYMSQQDVIRELIHIRDTFNTALIFISHDLSLVSHGAHEVIVMHKGCVVEQGKTDDVFYNPQEEYTRNLIETRQKIVQSFTKIMDAHHAS